MFYQLNKGTATDLAPRCWAIIARAVLTPACV